MNLREQLKLRQVISISTAKPFSFNLMESSTGRLKAFCPVMMSVIFMLYMNRVVIDRRKFPRKCESVIPSGLRLNLEPYTMSIFPSDIGLTKDGIISGRYSESASWITRILPCEFLIPVCNAAPLPMLCSCRIYVTVGNAATSFPVWSFEPSSTTIISTLPMDPLTLINLCRTSAMDFSSSYAGMMTLTSGHDNFFCIKANSPSI